MERDSEDRAYRMMQGKSTEELLRIWVENDRTIWSEQAFGAVNRVLRERGIAVPQPQEHGWGVDSGTAAPTPGAEPWPATKGAKIALGVATLWPLGYMVLFIGFTFSFMFYMFGHAIPPKPPANPPPFLLTIFALHFLTMFWTLALFIVYILHIVRTDRLPADQKALWAVILFLAGMVAMPIYWYLFIWRPRGTAAAT